MALSCPGGTEPPRWGDRIGFLGDIWGYRLRSSTAETGIRVPNRPIPFSDLDRDSLGDSRSQATESLIRCAILMDDNTKRRRQADVILLRPPLIDYRGRTPISHRRAATLSL